MHRKVSQALKNKQEEARKIARRYTLNKKFPTTEEELERAKAEYTGKVTKIRPGMHLGYILKDLR